MNWSSLWTPGKNRPARRQASLAVIALEILEDRLAPSASTDAAYQAWLKQTFHLNDVTLPTTPSVVANANPSVPQNASFGSMIGLPSVFGNTSYRGQGYSVAVIDTGIDYNDTSLGGGFGPGHKVIAGWDFVNNDADPMDDNGHGTFVANEIASTDPTYSGVAPGANLIALKVLAADGSGTYANVQAALDWVIANRAKYNIVAINLSLGSGNYTTNPYTMLDTEFNTLNQDGVFTAVASGNSFYTYNSVPGLAYPAVDPLVVSVGAVYTGNFGAEAWVNGARDNTTAADRIASFTQRDSSLDIMAPGALISGIGMNNKVIMMAGTSMASPVIAGAAVLIHQALDAQHMLANQSTILSIMQRTGVTVKDGDDENDNVTNTGLSFKRINVAAAIDSIGAPVEAPTLAPIADQNMTANSSILIALNGVNPSGGSLSYSATVTQTIAGLAYQLDQQFGLKYLGSYYTNHWGKQEKLLGGVNGTFYVLMPDGELRHWTGSITTTLQPAALIATLDPSYYADPSLLWNAKPVATVSASVTGNQLTLSAPAGVSGSFQVTVTASNGALSVSQSFTVTITAAPPAALAPIPNQSLASGSSLKVTLNGSAGLTYTASVAGSSSGASQAYQLQQQLQLKYLGSYYTNSFGQKEKTLGSASGKYYMILPNGQLRRWTGSMATTLQAANLVATLDASYYADPSKLYNAKPAATVSASVSGDQLTISATAGVTGSFQVTVTGSNGTAHVSQTFTVSVSASAVAAPTLAPITNQTMSAGGSLQVSLSGSAGLTYSASVLNGSQSSQAYQIQQQLKLKYLGSYYTNSFGEKEKFLGSASGSYYIILPSGDLRRWTGSMATTLQAPNLVASLGTTYYADPSLIYNAQPTNTISVTVVGSKITISAPAGIRGTFQIQVVGTNGTQSVTQTFTVTVS